MNREEKMSKMYNYCDGEHCSNCKVDKENPNHECGDGKGYSMDDNMVSSEELDMNYKIAFGKAKEEGKKLNKFKVGDVVEIKDGNDIENYTAGWSYEMRGNIGKKAKISSIEERDGMPCYRLCDFNYEKYTQSCVYDERGLELVEYPKTKTLTITTSDSTTTLTDGTHTTTINRYYTDKHDEKVAINEVVKKYYDELYEIDRASKEKHLICDKNDYGVIGTPTILTDSVGMKLFIGDVVKVCDDDGNNVATEFVCNCEPYGDFIMGCGYATMNNSKKEFNYLKEFSYEETVEKSLSFSGLVVK